MDINNKITCIIMFDEDSLDKINMYVSNNEFKFCKLKYDEENREQKDLLPFHSTICVWKIKSSLELKNLIKLFDFCEFKMQIIGTQIKESSQGSYNLYFELGGSEKLNKIQKFIYENENYRVEKYNPNFFIPHITIHIDKDFNKILKLQEKIMKNFKPFDVKVCKIGLYEIYPPKEIGFN